MNIADTDVGTITETVEGNVFTDAPNDDFTLTSGSSAINVATSVPNSPDGFNIDAWALDPNSMTKIARDANPDIGCFEYVGNLGKNVSNKIIPNLYSLNQNYPNPFNPSTVIIYSIKTVSNVKLEVFNVLGQNVATLVNEIQESGSYKVDFNASSLSSGIYIYRLKAGDFTDIKKMILVQ